MPCARFSGTPASSVSQLNAVLSSSKRSRTPYPTMSSLGRGAKSAGDSKRQNRPHVEYPIPSGQNVTLGLSVHLSDRPLRSSPSGQNVAFGPSVGWAHARFLLGRGRQRASSPTPVLAVEHREASDGRRRERYILSCIDGL